MSSFERSASNTTIEVLSSSPRMNNNTSRQQQHLSSTEEEREDARIQSKQGKLRKRPPPKNRRRIRLVVMLQWIMIYTYILYRLYKFKSSTLESYIYLQQPTSSSSSSSSETSTDTVTAEPATTTDENVNAEEDMLLKTKTVSSPSTNSTMADAMMVLNGHGQGSDDDTDIDGGGGDNGSVNTNTNTNVTKPTMDMKYLQRHINWNHTESPPMCGSFKCYFQSKTNPMYGYLIQQRYRGDVVSSNKPTKKQKSKSSKDDDYYSQEAKDVYTRWYDTYILAQDILYRQYQQQHLYVDVPQLVNITSKEFTTNYLNKHLMKYSTNQRLEGKHNRKRYTEGLIVIQKVQHASTNNYIHLGCSTTRFERFLSTMNVTYSEGDGSNNNNTAATTSTAVTTLNDNNNNNDNTTTRCQTLKCFVTKLLSNLKVLFDTMDMYPIPTSCIRNDFQFYVNLHTAQLYHMDLDRCFHYELKRDYYKKYYMNDILLLFEENDNKKSNSKNNTYVVANATTNDGDSGSDNGSVSTTSKNYNNKLYLLKKKYYKKTDDCYKMITQTLQQMIA